MGCLVSKKKLMQAAKREIEKRLNGHLNIERMFELTLEPSASESESESEQEAEEESKSKPKLCCLSCLRSKQKLDEGAYAAFLLRSKRLFCKEERRLRRLAEELMERIDQKQRCCCLPAPPCLPQCSGCCFERRPKPISISCCQTECPRVCCIQPSPPYCCPPTPPCCCEPLPSCTDLCCRQPMI